MRVAFLLCRSLNIPVLKQNIQEYLIGAMEKNMKYLFLTAILAASWWGIQHYNINIDRDFMYIMAMPLAYLFVVGLLFKG